MALVNTEPASLEVAFPGWHAWICEAGHCWATRRAPLPASRRPAGYELIVYASTPAALRARIAAQEAISSQHDDTAYPLARSTREGRARESTALRREGGRADHFRASGRSAGAGDDPA